MYLFEKHFFLWSPNSSWKPAPCQTCNFLFSCRKCLSIYLTCKFYKQEYTGMFWGFLCSFFFLKWKQEIDDFFQFVVSGLKKKMSMTEMLKKPSSSQPQKIQTSTGPSPKIHTAFPRPCSFYSLGSTRDFDLSMEHNTKYIWQFHHSRYLGLTSRWVKICILQLPTFIKMSY